MKVVQHLAAEGEIVTMRGQHGGLRLARPADTIRLGHVVRRSEPDMELLPHLDPGHADAEGAAVGAISTVVSRARDAFLAVLDEHTVADLVTDPAALAPFLRHTGRDLAVQTA
jgi:Rrf2 family nitric oxide-sensitive transcriptional repressor